MHECVILLTEIQLICICCEKRERVWMGFLTIPIPEHGVMRVRGAHSMSADGSVVCCDHGSQARASTAQCCMWYGVVQVVEPGCWRHGRKKKVLILEDIAARQNGVRVT